MAPVRRVLVGLLTFLLLPLLIVDLTIRAFDPLEAHAYASDLSILSSSYIQHPEYGRVLLPGEYQAGKWSFRILDDHTRHVPDAQEHTCTIALVGDSATFAYGVSDADTWANLIAPQVPARIVNTGVPGYNIAEVRQTIESYPADGYVYLLFPNDAEAPISCCSAARNPPDSGLIFYINWFRRRAEEKPLDLAMFDSEAAIISGREDTITLAFEGWHLTDRIPDAAVIPPYVTRVSPADGHADAEGNRLIADGALPHIQALTASVCAL